jgi:DNA repair protein RadC
VGAAGSEGGNMLDALDSSLEAVGLSVSQTAPANGPPVFAVKGETHPLRHILRELGGRWDGINRVWVFSGDDPRPQIAERVSAERTVGGLSDVAPVAELLNRPHYWGHRQRLRDRFLAGEDDGLPDYELLELVLFFAVPKVDTKPMAKELLQRFGSLGGVLHASADQLAEFERINHFALTLFKAIRAMAQRIAREEVSDAPVLDNWEKLVAYLRTTMAHRKVEQFRLLFLDRRNVLIADEVQHEGTIDHTPVYPREVIKRALALDASAIVMVHNHPSNHPQPSKPDIEMTRQIREVVEKVGIVLHDHLIVSKRGQTSFRQMGLMGR